MADENKQDELDRVLGAPQSTREDDFEAGFNAAMLADSSVGTAEAEPASNEPDEEPPVTALDAMAGDNDTPLTQGEDQTEQDTDAASSSQDDFAKREHALKSKLGREIADLKRQLETAQSRPAPVVIPQQQVEEEPKLDLTALREEYSELSPLFDTVEKMNAQLNALKQPINQMAVSQAEQAFNSQYDIYTSAHRDYAAFNPNHELADREKLEAFAQWAQEQPKAVQDMIHRTNNAETFDGKEAAYVLKQFKQDLGFTQPSPELRPTPKPQLSAVREKQLSAAIAVPAGAQTPVVSQSDPDDFVGSFNIELQREARRTGKPI
jgi:hypothetical protein